MTTINYKVVVEIGTVNLPEMKLFIEKWLVGLISPRTTCLKKNMYSSPLLLNVETLKLKQELLNVKRVKV